MTNNRFIKYFKLKLEKYPIIFIFLFCFITRIPQLISPLLMLDPDECVTAIMAKHLMQGEDISLYFWGQNYGLTIIESAAIVPFYFVFGISTISVKLAMLCLWSVGVVFFYKSLVLLTLNDKSKSFLLAFLFVCLPAWGIWSMQARGGYLSSFALSSLLIYLLFLPKWSNNIIKYLMLGVIFQLIFQSQLLWLIGITPLICYRICKDPRPYINTFIFLSINIVLWYIFHQYQLGIQNVYQVGPVLPEMEYWQSYLERFPDWLYYSFQGRYYFTNYPEPDPASAIVSGLSVASSALLIILAFKELLISKQKNILFILSTVFIGGFYLFSFFITLKSGRYFLPMSEFMIISWAIYLRNSLVDQWAWCVKTIAFIGIVSLNTFWNVEFETNIRNNIQEMVSYLKEHQLKYLYCKEYMLPWHLSFYSNEEITARIPYKNGRFQAYHDLVDSNYTHGGKTAIVGEKRNCPGFFYERAIFINEYYILSNPTDKELKEHFEFEGSSLNLH